MENYKKQLMDCGLTEHQSILYELLIKSGALRASAIVRRLDNSLSRPMVYAVLDELTVIGLVEKDTESANVTRFVPAHPSKLQDIAYERRQIADTLAEAASAIIPRIVSDYNLTSSKPGVRFFEGKQGVRAVLQDSLTTKTHILSYTDVEQIETHYKDVSDPYILEREKRGILKKLLLDDTPYVRAFYAGLTEKQSEVRLIQQSEYPHKVAIQIYDDKVSYLTLTPGKEMAVIIQDADISALQRHLFLQLYKNATSLYTPSTDDSGVL